MIAAIVVVACATATSTTTVPSQSSPTATTTPTPSPTPPPEVVLIADSELAWESDLKALAAQRGWVLTRADPSGAVAYLREARPHIAAVVSNQETLDGDLQQAAAEGIPIVLVNAPGIEAGSLLSTVGNLRHDQAGFLAGVMIGLASETGWVGQVTATGGPDETAYNAGFTQGLLWGCPKCQLVSQTAAELTLDGFRAKGVDVVFPFPGSTTDDAAGVLAGGGIPMVWVGEGGPPQEALIGRLVFEDGPLVSLALENLLTTREGQAWQPSIESHSLLPVDISSEFLSPGRQRLLEEAYEAIAAGELDIGTILDA